MAASPVTSAVITGTPAAVGTKISVDGCDRTMFNTFNQRL